MRNFPLRKATDDSPSRVVRDLLEGTTNLHTAGPDSRAQRHVMRTVRELELMGWLQGLDDDFELVEVEYDKFRSRVR